MYKRRIFLCITLAEQGGAQGFLLKLAKYLQKNDIEVTVVAGQGDWLKDRCREQNIPFLEISALKREIHPVQDWKAVKELTDMFRKERPDAVHLNSTKMGVIGSYAAKRAGINRVVYRIGGWVFLEKLPAWKKWLYKELEKWSARWKDIILCVHPGDAKVAGEAGIKPRQYLTAIPNGIDIAHFRNRLLSREEARSKLMIDDEVVLFGTVANFFPPKNLPDYMAACRLVADRMAEAKFMIIGEGRERERVEQKRKEFNLEDRVLLPGAIEDASTLLRAFDVFVLPSSKEGMSFALLEAMAAGLPIVATEVGAAAFMLENERCGWLSPYSDMNKLAEQMLHAADSLPANQKGKLAAEKAERDLPLERMLLANKDALLG